MSGVSLEQQARDLLERCAVRTLLYRAANAAAASWPERAK